MNMSKNLPAKNSIAGVKMKRLVAALSVAAGVSLLLSGCGAPAEGYVHDKKYSAAYTYSTTDCVSRQVYRHSDGSSYSTCTMYVQTPHRVPASYKLDIYSQDGDKHGWKNVTKSEYSRLGVGDWYGSTKSENNGF